MKKNTFDIVKKFWLVILFVVVFIVFIALLIASSDNKIINDIKEFISDNTKVLYISNNKNYSDYPIKLLNKYDIEYMYVNSEKLSQFEKTKIENLINSKYLSNIIVIFKDGEIIDAIIDYKDEESLNKFFQKYNIIPEVIGDIDNILTSIPDLLNTDLTLLYIPYKYSDDIDSQNKILKQICDRYDISYKSIDAYLLSYAQHEKLNSLLQISSVEDQIVILIKNKKIIGSIRGKHRKNTYIDNFYKQGFIDEIDNYLIGIEYNAFKRLLNDEKNIIVIGKDDCKYCKEVVSTLNTIIINYDIKVYYINIVDLENNIAKNVERDLLNLGYDDGFTTPITIIVESNKLLDYIIGSSDEKYFVEKFIENGIIK